MILHTVIEKGVERERDADFINKLICANVANNYTDIQFFLNIVSLCMTRLLDCFFMLFTDIFSEYFYHPRLERNM
jgi:hypothetical protein